MKQLINWLIPCFKSPLLSSIKRTLVDVFLTSASVLLHRQNTDPLISTQARGHHASKKYAVLIWIRWLCCAAPLLAASPHSWAITMGSPSLPTPNTIQVNGSCTSASNTVLESSVDATVTGVTNDGRGDLYSIISTDSSGLIVGVGESRVSVGSSSNTAVTWTSTNTPVAGSGLDGVFFEDVTAAGQFSTGATYTPVNQVASVEFTANAVDSDCPAPLATTSTSPSTAPSIPELPASTAITPGAFGGELTTPLSYILTIIQVEFKNSKGEYVTIASEGSSYDAASVGTNTSVGSFGKTGALANGTYSEIRITLNRTFGLTFSASDKGSACRTNGGSTTDEFVTLTNVAIGSSDGGDATLQQIKFPSGSRASSALSSASVDELGDTLSISRPVGFTIDDKTLPLNIKINFNIENSVEVLTAGGNCLVIPEPPSVNISVSA